MSQKFFTSVLEDGKLKTTSYRISETNAMRLFTHTNDAFFFIDRAGKITVWASGAEKLFGVTAEKVLSTPFTGQLNLLEKEFEWDMLIGKVLEQEQPFSIQVAIKSKNMLPANLMMVPLEADEQGSVVSFVANSIPDVLSHEAETILKEKNRELRALNNELKTFTSVAAYDYKEILQNLYTNLEFIITREAQNLSNNGKANLRKAQTAIQKMKLLTDDIVEFSKIRTPESQPAQVDLNEVISTILDELTAKIQEAGADVQIQPLPVIQGYPFLLELLFYHLLDNAIKFRRDGALVKIEIEHGYTQDRDTGAPLHSITVADNGIGLPQDETSKVFQMFYKIHDKKYRGSGVGLAICKKITDLHGGTMAVEGEPGMGTKVCCFFPVR